MFCSNCGSSISEDTKFCAHCGAQQPVNEQATSVNTEKVTQKSQKAAKRSKKKIIGIVLLCLQAVSIFGIVVNGELANLTSFFTGGVSGIFEMLGFFLPAIVGAVLLVLAFLKEKK